MSDQFKIDGHAATVLPDETVEWFNNSELAGDERTMDVVRHIENIESAGSGTNLGIDAKGAIIAGYFHRAVDLGTVDGKPIEDLDDIPGAVGSFECAMIRGWKSKSAMQDHCHSGEEKVGAVLVNIASRWADGKQAYKWTLETVDDVYSGYGSGATGERMAIERLQN